jgi:hypothetical protein
MIWVTVHHIHQCLLQKWCIATAHTVGVKLGPSCNCNCCCNLNRHAHPAATRCYVGRLKKRKEFEDTVRRVGRWNLAVWAKVGLRPCGGGSWQ